MGEHSLLWVLQASARLSLALIRVNGLFSPSALRGILKFTNQITCKFWWSFLTSKY